MYEPLERSKHDQPPWSTKYPKPARILDGHPQTPPGNTLKRNVSVRSGWRDPEAECRKTFRKHIDPRYASIADNYVTDEAPGFVDAAQMNFPLRQDSVVRQRAPGFRKIPFDRIGPYPDDDRAHLPPGPP